MDARRCCVWCTRSNSAPWSKPCGEKGVAGSENSNLKRRERSTERMRILIYSANFAPEPTGVGKYSGEMAAWLVDRGHEVRVVAAPPYYPDWKLDAHYAWPPFR